MDLYDLDKTQEWLNRTMQVGATPATRGGLVPDHRARRHVAASVAVTALALALCTLFGPRPHATTTAATAAAAAPGSSPAQDVASIAPAAPPLAPPITSAPTTRPAGPVLFDDGGILLSGNVHPLPGHVAPPAPIWLDGIPLKPLR